MKLGRAGVDTSSSSAMLCGAITCRANLCSILVLFEAMSPRVDRKWSLLCRSDRQRFVSLPLAIMTAFRFKPAFALHHTSTERITASSWRFCPWLPVREDGLGCWRGCWSDRPCPRPSWRTRQACRIRWWLRFELRSDARGRETDDLAWGRT